MRKIKLARLVVQVLGLIPKRFQIYSAEMQSQPIFVFGSGRNGSTLLNRMLHQHSQLFAPTEQYFLGPGILKFHLYNHMLNWRDLSKVIVGELEASTGSHTWDYKMRELYPAIFNSNDQSLQRMIDFVYRSYGSQTKTSFKRWVETSPPNIHYVKEIFRTFPEATYYFMIRDGRDVVNSYMAGGDESFGNFSKPEEAAKLWKQSIDAYHWLNHKTGVKLVRYEKLVTNTEKELRDLCNWAQIPYEKSMLDFHQKPLAPGHHDQYFHNITKPVFKSSIGKWKEEMNKETLDKIMPVIDKQLKQFDYL